MRGKGGRGERREENRGRGGLSGNVAEEAFCLKSAPVDSSISLPFILYSVNFQLDVWCTLFCHVHDLSPKCNLAELA